MSLTLKAEQPTFGKKSESHNRKKGGNPRILSIFLQYQARVTPAGVLARVISCRYVVKWQAKNS